MAELLKIGYGKEAVSVYRTDGVSSLFAAEIGMTLRGASFVPSYTEGDNTLVVATDSMKNFIHITALEYDDASLDGFLELLARRFLATYEQVELIELTGREVPFERRAEQAFQGDVRGDRAVARLTLDRDGTLEHRCGREGRPAREAQRKLLRGLRPRRVHDPCGFARPAALHPPRCPLAKPGLREARGRDGGPGLRRRDLRRLRLGLDPGARPRDGPAAPRRASPRSTRSPSSARTASGTRRRSPGGSSACACTRTRARRTAGSS